MDEQRYEIQMERDIIAKMRDGVVLRADVFRPTAAGRFPVIMQRTPYNKANYNANGAPFAIRAAARGYVVILQDVRGRFASDGDWYPFQHEVDDGYDTVEWAAALPYSNGKVGMFGWSYLGVTQMSAALAQPPHLVSLFPVVTACDYYDEWTYRGGVFQQFFNESWASFRLAPDTLDRRVKKSANAMNRVWELPLGGFSFFETGSVRDLAPYFFHWLEHSTYDDYWKQWSLNGRFGNIAVPCYHVGGWYDIFLNGTLRNYMGLKAHGGTAEARNGQRLMIGPWYHDSFSGRQIRRSEFCSRRLFQRRRRNASLVRLHVERYGQRLGRKASPNFRDGRKCLARRRGLASAARQIHAFSLAFRRKRQFLARRRFFERFGARS